MSNPLLDFSSLPRFASIRPAHVAPAADELIASGRATIERLAVLDSAPTWENFVEPLDDANEKLARAWSAVSHMNAVVNTPEFREAYNAALPKITEYFSEQGQDQRLHAGFKSLAATPGFESWPAARRRHVELQLRDFRLGGAELPPPKKARFLEIQAALAKLGARFQDNVLDATNAFGLYVDDASELSGIPADVLQTAHEAAANEGRQGWKLTLHMPCYMPVMQYADNHGLRERMYRANVTRASESGKPEWDNTPNMRRTLELRAEAAALLGYASFAEVSLATKMAATPREALAFLEDLARRSKPFAERDMEELRSFARDELDMADVRASDVAYVSEKLRQRRYAFSDQEVKQYFREDEVLAGLFRLVETLYGLSIRPGSVEVWHPTVRFHEITDRTGALVGQFYLDAYARENKRGGAWMNDVVNRRRLGSRVQTPVAFLTCNFSAPVGGKPALFTHREVSTLFHEFGHGLHQLLTQVDELGVSGIHGVEWDAVELPSQFMENFVWRAEVLPLISAHIDTGEPLPVDMLQRLLGTRTFNAALDTLRQIELATFDFELHANFDPKLGANVAETLAAVRRRVAVVPAAPFNRMPASFAHIFAGGYAAGYYSYKWAEVLAADAFEAFEEAGVFDAETAARFCESILARGGSVDAMDAFVRFRGRQPDVRPLLKQTGIAA